MDIRNVLRRNVRALMERYDVANPYALSRWMKARGVTISQRSIAYVLDESDDRYQRLDTVEGLAAGFRLQPWQLLVPQMDPGNPPALQPLPAEPRLSRRPVKAKA